MYQSPQERMEVIDSADKYKRASQPHPTYVAFDTGFKKHTCKKSLCYSGVATESQEFDQLEVVYCLEAGSCRRLIFHSALLPDYLRH
jgi:hypothetical protein